jgi:Predicted O-methyltransferase
MLWSPTPHSEEKPGAPAPAGNAHGSTVRVQRFFGGLHQGRHIRPEKSGGLLLYFSSERLAELFFLLQKYKLEPKLLQPLQAREHKECGLILLKAVKNGRPGLKLKAPILIYELGEEGTQPSLTEEILKFCPWLSCNAKHGVKTG